MSAPRGSSYDRPSVAALCAPISAPRQPEFLGAACAGSSLIDPRSDRASNMRQARRLFGAAGALAKKIERLRARA